MTFWSRHLILLALSVVLPFLGALYVDTESELARARDSGVVGARLGAQSLENAVTLEAHRVVAKARELAARLDGVPRKFEASDEGQALAKLAPEAGFLWVADAEGVVRWAHHSKADGYVPQPVVRGHPLFVQTQLGAALDGFWPMGTAVYHVAAAPVDSDGRAEGAVLVGRPVTAEWLARVAAKLAPDVTLLWRDRAVVSTLDAPDAIVGPAKQSTEPVQSGALQEPLGHAYLPLLPVLVDHRAEGLAFTSLSAQAPGTPDVRWVVSVRSAAVLEGLAVRQEIILGGLAASLMLAILMGLLNFRTFVTPIERIAHHISEIQMGRGDLELPEGRVSRPFRRLVRLVNMTVQKLPSRGLSMGSKTSSSDRLPAAGAGASSTSELPLSLQSDGLSVGGGTRPLEELDGPVAPPEPLIGVSPPSRDLPAADGGADADGAAPLSLDDHDSVLEIASSEVEPLAVAEDGSWDLVHTPGQTADHVVDEAGDAFADAIRSLESAGSADLELPEVAFETPETYHGQAETQVPELGAASDEGSAPPKRSASEIRGRPVDAAAVETVGADTPFAPSASEVLRAEPLPSAPTLASELEGLMQQLGGDESGGAGASLDSALSGTDEFGPDATVVADAAPDLLQKSAVPDAPVALPGGGTAPQEMTVVANVSEDLLAASAGDRALDEEERHLREVFESFVELRRQCGEDVDDVHFGRFREKLLKNREGLIAKYQCQTVRFQVYEKSGRAALRATPVRS